MVYLVVIIVLKQIEYKDSENYYTMYKNGYIPAGDCQKSFDRGRGLPWPEKR